jgi:hypothetical protein
VLGASDATIRSRASISSLGTTCSGVLSCLRRAERIESEIAPRDVRNAFRTKTVDAHVDAIEADLPQQRRELWESDPICRKRDIGNPGNRAQHPNQFVKLRAYGWFTTCDSQASQAEWRQLPDDVSDLFVGEDL